MSDNKNNTKYVRDDEIDLLEFFRRMGKTLNEWFKSLGIALLKGIVFLLKRWLPLSLSVALGVGASYLFKYTSDSFFTADLVLRNNTVANADMISYLNRLHTYCEEENISELASAISFTPEQINNIVDISAFWIIDNGGDGIPDYVDYKNNHNIYDTVNLRMPNRLDVRVKIKSPQVLLHVRNGIIKFIESDSLFQQRNHVRLRQNQELITRLDYDRKQLDSLQKIKYFVETLNQRPSSGGQILNLQGTNNTQLIYPDIQSLISRKQALESERDLYKGIVTVISEFSLPAVRENGGFYYAKYFVPILFFFTLLILILLANRKKLEDVYNKY
jgi:hypothetical protein